VLQWRANGGRQMFMMVIGDTKRGRWRVRQTVPYDRVAVTACMYIFFCVTSSFSVFETIGSPFTNDNLGWGVEQNSLFFTLAALATVVFFIAVKPMAARIGDRWTLLSGLVVSSVKLTTMLRVAQLTWHAV